MFLLQFKESDVILNNVSSIELQEKIKGEWKRAGKWKSRRFL